MTVYTGAHVSTFDTGPIDRHGEEVVKVNDLGHGDIEVQFADGEWILADADEVQATPFPHTSTRELLAMNATYLREYEADPTPAKRAAVEKTSRELSRRGA